MKSMFTIVIALIIMYTILRILSSFGFAITPSPRDPDDYAPSCRYEYCYDDECIQSSDYSKQPCIRPLCGPDIDKYYCVLKDDKCTKKLKPKCIRISGSYFCSNLKYYDNQSCTY